MTFTAMLSRSQGLKGSLPSSNGAQENLFEGQKVMFQRKINKIFSQQRSGGMGKFDRCEN